MVQRRNRTSVYSSRLVNRSDVLRRTQKSNENRNTTDVKDNGANKTEILPKTVLNNNNKNNIEAARRAPCINGDNTSPGRPAAAAVVVRVAPTDRKVPNANKRTGCVRTREGQQIRPIIV